jgi:hypothetical protein
MAAPLADTIAKLKSVWETAVDRWSQAQALALSEGDKPNFTLEGVGVSWPEYEAHLIDNIAQAKKQYMEALELSTAVDQFEGPVVEYTFGR